MTRRNATKRRVRAEAKSYQDLYVELAPRERHIINEKVIQAVCKLANSAGQSHSGSKSFLETRARQLILDMRKEGLTTANKRFKDAIAGRVQRVGRPPEPDHSGALPYAGT